MRISSRLSNRFVGTVSASLFLVLLAACGASSGSPDDVAAVATASESAAPAIPSPQATKAVVELTPLNSEKLMVGDATPAELPAGDPGVVSVVYVGPLSTQNGSKLPIVIRNNTDKAISHVDVTATARSGGVLVVTGTSQGTTPAQVAPGGLALAFIYFDMNAAVPPADATFQFTFETSAADTSSYNTATLKATEAQRSGGSIVGTGVNATDATVVGPFAANVYCFDAAGHVSSTVGTYTNESAEIAPGGTVSFTADLYGAACETFLVGITGYFA